jgi:hypothetical protein
MGTPRIDIEVVYCIDVAPCAAGGTIFIFVGRAAVPTVSEMPS